MKNQAKNIVYSVYLAIRKIIKEEYHKSTNICDNNHERTFVVNPKIDGMIIGVVTLASQQLQQIGNKEEFFYWDKMRALASNLVIKFLDYPNTSFSQNDFDELVDKICE